MSRILEPADTLDALARLVQVHPAPTALVSAASGLLLAVNGPLLALTGLGRDATVGRPFPSSLFAECDVALELSLAAGRPGRAAPRRCRRQDGREVQLLWACERLEVKGEPLAVITFTEVTHLAGGSLVHSTALLAALAEHAFDAVGAVRPDGQIVYASPSAAAVTGYEPAELERANIFDIIHPEDRQLAIESLGRALADPGAPESVVVRFRHRSGEWRYCETAGRQIEDEQEGPLVIVHYRDVTESIHAEAGLRASDERFRHMFELSPLPAALIRDRDGMMLEANAAFLELAGYEPGEVAGRLTNAEFWPHEEERLGIGRLVRAEGAARNFPIRFRTRAGRELDTLNFADAIVVNGEPCVLGTAVDVTEARALERRLQQVEKLDAVARLAAGVAHDFNNVLGVIKLEVGILGRNPSFDADAREGLAEVDAATVRAATMTRQLLAFSRSQGAAPRPVDLHRAIDGLALILKPLLGGGISIKTSLPADLWPVMADAAQLDQVVMNLAANARDAMSGRGTFTISARNRSIGDEAFVPAPGDYVVISFSDTGTGIDEPTMVRIFEPFFTTKPPGQGTGLGLASVHGIVTQHGGAIAVESQPGVGATFTIHWPRAR